MQRYLPVALLVTIILSMNCRPAFADTQGRYPWPRKSVASQALSEVIPPPAGYVRVPVSKNSFAEWLRGLPLQPLGSEVHLWNGTLRSNQSAHFAVVDLDVYRYQECADAWIRLVAEYLWSAGKADQVVFRFTDGTPARWVDWARGLRPHVSESKTTWTRAVAPDASRIQFRAYLEVVMTYAGTMSLSQDLSRKALTSLGAGDLLVQGGRPGHAVVVLDVAKDAQGHRVMLLAQSYMPAQEFHVLRNPGAPALSPWYALDDLASDGLKTPDWVPFLREDIRGLPI